MIKTIKGGHVMFRKIFKNTSIVILFVIFIISMIGCSSNTGGNQTAPAPGNTSTENANETENTPNSNWPERPINIVVGFGAGGNTDLVNRTLGSLMAQDLGTNITVTNMTGGTGGIAADHVFKNGKDGYTILGAPESLRILAVAGYHPTLIGKDWSPLIAAKFDGVISVPKDSPIKDFAELIEQARQNPNTIKYSASSAGVIYHLQSVIMNQKGNVPMQFIPYQGSHPSATAAIAGEVDVVQTGLGEQAELIRAGELRPLVMFSDQAYEMEGVGTIPPITDYLPELKEYLPMDSWVGMAIPSEVPDDIKKLIESAYLKAVQTEEFAKFIKEREGIVLGYGLEESLEVGLKESSSFSWLLYDLGAVPNSPEDFNIPKP